jgi:hypothetical protein
MTSPPPQQPSPPQETSQLREDQIRLHDQQMQEMIKVNNIDDEQDRFSVSSSSSSISIDVKNVKKPQKKINKGREITI